MFFQQRFSSHPPDFLAKLLNAVINVVSPDMKARFHRSSYEKIVSAMQTQLIPLLSSEGEALGEKQRLIKSLEAALSS